MKKLQLDRYIPAISEITDEELYELVLSAQSGNETSLEELLFKFRNFLAKYYMLLVNGKFDSSDRDVRMFLSLYVAPPGSRGYLMGNKLNEQGRKRVQELIQRLNIMVSQAEPDDVEQTLVLAFIHCVHRYEKREGIEFLGFIKNYYRFIVQRYVNEYLLDQHGLHSAPLPEDGFLESEEYLESQNEAEVPEATDPALTTPGGLEDLLGGSDGLQGDLWECLTQQQRWLVVWRWVDKEKIRDIADRFGWSTREVKEQLQEVKTKIATVTGREI